MTRSDVDSGVSSGRWFRTMLIAGCLFACFAVFQILALGQAPGADDLNIPGLTDGLLVAVPAPADDTMAAEVDTSLLGLIAAGGWSMWVLGAFSLALVGLTVYCAMDLRVVNFSPGVLRDSLHAHLQIGNLESAFELARTDETTLGRMVAKVGDQIEETGYSTEDNDMLRDLMAEAGVKANRMRARVINYFSVLAQAAPMMGLLGTVSGMIKAFGTLQRKGMGNPSELAGNISEALVTTAAGLIIALPAIFLYFFFRDRLEELVSNCEEFGLELLGALRRVVYASAAKHASEAETVPDA